MLSARRVHGYIWMQTTGTCDDWPTSVLANGAHGRVRERLRPRCGTSCRPGLMLSVRAARSDSRQPCSSLGLYLRARSVPCWMLACRARTHEGRAVQGGTDMDFVALLKFR